MRGRQAREAEGAHTPTSAPLLPQQTLSPRPLSPFRTLHPAGERAARERRWQGSDCHVRSLLLFPSPASSPLLPHPQPGFGGDSPLVPETIASGRAALRLPRVFVSSSCKAPGPGAGSAAAAAEAGAKRCSARPPGAAPSLGGGAGGRRPATHSRRPALLPPRTNAAAAAGNEPSRPAGSGVGSPAGSGVGRAGAAALAAHTPRQTHPTPLPCATRMEQPPRPGTGARKGSS
ncbi:leucine-rich repeat-containing protein 3B isoform X2 [Panthera onca]